MQMYIMLSKDESVHNTWNSVKKSSSLLLLCAWCNLSVGLEKKARWKGSGQYPELSEHLPGPFLQPRLLSLSQEGVKRQKQRRFPPLLQHPNSTSSPKDTKQPDKVREPS